MVGDELLYQGGATTHDDDIININKNNYECAGIRKNELGGITLEVTDPHWFKQ